MISFFFLRHAETVANRASVIMGSLDLPLNVIGEQQAMVIRSLIENIKPNSIFCSRQLRAVQTAQIVTSNLNGTDIQILDSLGSRNRGSWEGLSWREVERIREAKGMSLTDVPPEAEQWDAFLARSLAALNVVLRSPPPVLVIAHTGTLYALAEHLRIDKKQANNASLQRFYMERPYLVWRRQEIIP